MADLHDIHWSQSEKTIARRAYDCAYRRECEAIKGHVEDMIRDATDPRDIWRVHDFLSRKRQETDAKYDYRYSVLIVVFGRLLRQGWLKEADLQGLGEDKIERIRLLGSGCGGARPAP
jgi:hypothetical protein